jgi:hypothetical protein
MELLLCSREPVRNTRRHSALSGPCNADLVLSRTRRTISSTSGGTRAIRCSSLMGTLANLLQDSAVHNGVNVRVG